MDKQIDLLPTNVDSAQENLIHPSFSEIVALPAVPYALELQNGELVATERPPVTDPFIPNSLKKLYRPNIISEERTEQIKTLAEYAGYDDIESLLSANASIDEIRASAPPYLIRRLRESPSVVDVMYEMKRAAMERVYAERVIELARELMASRLPHDLLPQEATSVLVENDIPTLGWYLGKFGGNHLVQLRGGNITEDDIHGLGLDSDIVAVAAHELIHQRHAEVQNKSVLTAGLPDAAPFNEVQTDDPWESLRLREQYVSEINQSDSTFPMRRRLCSHLCETIAYLGEGEIRGYVEETSFTVGVTSTGEQSNDDFNQTEHLWVTTFSEMAPVGQRGDIIRRLMRVDFEQFSSMSEEELTDMINNPMRVFEFER